MRDLVSSDVFSSVYEDARERVEESAYEDAEEFFDAEEAIRELSQSMGEESTVSDACVSRGTFEYVVRCPNVTVDVPFDASVTRATVRTARVSVGARATVAFDDATCTYGYDEAHTVDLRARGLSWLGLRNSSAKACRAPTRRASTGTLARPLADAALLGRFRTFPRPLVDRAASPEARGWTPPFWLASYCRRTPLPVSQVLWPSWSKALD